MNIIEIHKYVIISEYHKQNYIKNYSIAIAQVPTALFHVFSCYLGYYNHNYMQTAPSACITLHFPHSTTPKYMIFLTFMRNFSQLTWALSCNILQQSLCSGIPFGKEFHQTNSNSKLTQQTIHIVQKLYFSIATKNGLRNTFFFASFVWNCANGINRLLCDLWKKVMLHKITWSPWFLPFRVVSLL